MRPPTSTLALLLAAACTRAPVPPPPQPVPRRPPTLADYPVAAADLARELTGTISPAETVASALAASGLGAADVDEIVRALTGVFDFRKARPGARYTLELNLADDRLQYFRFDNEVVDRVEAERDAAGNLRGRRIEVPLERTVAAVGVAIHQSLYQSLDDSGEDPELASLLAEVFAWDIDFYRDQHPGDRFRVLVEKLSTSDGVRVGYGRVIAAEYAGRAGTFHTFWYAPAGDAGKGDYFLADGRSARKFFLATPLQFTRVSSNFSYSRKHPILGYNKAHMGVDYAAPRGTPVRAMASGIVTFAGRSGASGNLVKIRHGRSGLESAYAHLNQIDGGIRRGARVSQKQRIGTVGATGRATGPHLHFGVQKNGTWVNPQSLKMSRLDSIAANYRSDFDRTVAAQVARLAEIAIPGDSGHGEPSLAVAALAGE